MTPNLQKLTPEHIFETSWEVCNKVGGIYTVLSTKAKTMVDKYGHDKVIFIGPDVWHEQTTPWFVEDKTLLADWKTYAKTTNNLDVKIGLWDIPGKPIAILVNFQQFFAQKETIYSEMWDKFKVDSLHAYGDYDESCMFAFATGVVIESIYTFNKLEDKNVIAHFNEWMLGMGALYIKDRLPKVATVFTTHATSIGRSIAGNHKPLYNYLSGYNGDQMADELNMTAKHSIEKTAALEVDCFTTVSEITAKECKQLIGRAPEVTPNGFEQDFVPKGKTFQTKRNKARKALINVAEKLYGVSIKDDALLVATSGRYEYRNKGIDVFIDGLNRLNQIKKLNKDIVAFVMVPAWTKEPRTDLIERLKSTKKETTSLEAPYITHWLHDMSNDSVLNQINYLKLNNAENKVKFIFVPSYLNGNDGILNMSYYDLLIGLDATVFPSYYEPWGYTPHESVAFSVPTITTTLAGFGLWMKKLGDKRGMDDGVEVIYRDDYNFVEVAETICEMLYQLTTKNEAEMVEIRKTALEKARAGDWSHFFPYYEEAYAKAIKSSADRLKNA